MKIPPTASLTTSRAAAVLGVSPQNLRRWVREGKFDSFDGMRWDQNPGFKRQRVYSAEWVEHAAQLLGVEPDWSQVAS